MNATDNFNLLINKIIKSRVTITRTDLAELLKYLDISFMENYGSEILDFKSGYENLYLHYNILITGKKDTIYSELMKRKLHNDEYQFISYNNENFIKLHWFHNTLRSYESCHYLVREMIEIVNKLIDCIKFIDNKLNIENNLQKLSFREIVPFEKKVFTSSQIVKDCRKEGFWYHYFPEMESDKFNRSQSNKRFTFNLIDCKYIECE